MPRPHPVVHFAAEVAQVLGRCIDQTDVLQPLETKEVILVSGVHAGDRRADVRALLLGFSDKLFLGLLDRIVDLEIGHPGTDIPDNLGCDLFIAEENVRCIALGRDFFSLRPGQESILEVVFLLGRGSLNGTEGDMVVGQYEALRRDKFSCPAAQVDDSAHQPGAVLLEEAFRVHLQADLHQVQVLHLVGHPHALVGLNDKDEDKARGQAGSQDASEKPHIRAPTSWGSGGIILPVMSGQVNPAHFPSGLFLSK